MKPTPIFEREGQWYIDVGIERAIFDPPGSEWPSILVHWSATLSVKFDFMPNWLELHGEARNQTEGLECARRAIRELAAVVTPEPDTAAPTDAP